MSDMHAQEVDPRSIRTFRMLWWLGLGEDSERLDFPATMEAAYAPDFF